MAPRQFQPLEVNSKTGEPFLRLPSPLDHIIITPSRESDKPDIIRYLNDERVVRWLSGPPHPYLQEHADWWIGECQKTERKTLRELREAETRDPEGALIFVDHCPIRSIREIKPSGEEIFIGDCGIQRCLFDEFEGDEDSTKLTQAVEENTGKVTGDPSIVWCVGDYLAPSHQGQGIMSAVFSTLLNYWAIPRLNAHILRVYTFTSNRASARVFEKNGFHLVKTIQDWKEVKGVMHGLNVFEWRLSTSPSH
ncbi:hypothetical protein HWV62_21280 [Athelia sp. TMB]|nr:hypothetical protein HWV62_21280 [Athelia sp. TMB]